VVLLLFDSLERASRAVLEILQFAPSACDLMDRRHLSLARENDVRYELIIPQQTEAVLLVEQDGESAAEVRQRISDVLNRVERKKRLAFGAHVAVDNEEVDLLWKLARDVAPTLARMKGSSRPVPFVEDLAVPPETLPEFLVHLQNVLKRHHVTASLFGHAGHGQLHIRPFLDLADPDDVRKMQHLAQDLYDGVSKVGGTISGEHGDGLSRTPFLQRQFGPLVEVFRRVKEIFDPAGILNPGKIVPVEGSALVRDLRPATCSVAMGSAAAGGQGGVHGPWPAQLQLAWQPNELTEMTQHCNGCGACRSQSPDVRMCPVFRLLPHEEASPRAKANLMRGVVTGELDTASLTRDEFKAIADLCIHCHMCRLECPSAVDIPKLMVEGKAAYVATNGLRPTDWLMTRIDRLSALGCQFHPFANWALGNRQARWLIERVLGIAQGRKLPRFAKRPFLLQAARRRLGHATRHRGPKVIYFVDTYANYHDSQLAEAVVAVMQHNGIAVYVDPRQLHSAMPMIANGAVDKARQVARENVNLLADAVRQGYTVVGSEPSAVLCLTREYPQLLDDDDTRLVAAHSQEACHYLWQLHQKGKLQLDFKPLHFAVSYHAPCHLKALEVGTPGENLLRLIPGLSVNRIERGCSGMAGTYGLKRENYRSSLKAGWGLISELRASSAQVGTTECSTCKMQMELASRKPTIHPLKLLAVAYDLIPEIRSLLTTPSEDLIVT
ncbi:MAG: anaerobic glycerol-3-phosphate dehydrogenase subunit C, partial [Pirellulales bacterium]